jgi:hypothetical protein
MLKLCVILLLASIALATGVPDTLWATEFPDIPEGWHADLHWNRSHSLRLTLNSYVQRVFDFDHSSLASCYMYSMTETDSLVLVVRFAWTGWGAYSGGDIDDGAYSRSRINVRYGDACVTLWDSVAGYLWFGGTVDSPAGGGPYSTTSRGTLTLRLPDIPDWQTYFIEFRGDTGCFQDPSGNRGQYAYVDWKLESAVLLDYRSRED